MRNQVYVISKKYIQFLYSVMIFTSVALPVALMSLSLKRDVTFEFSFIVLLSVLGFVIFITFYHEGRKVIQSIQNRRLELTDARLLIIQDKKKELVFYDELEGVTVYKNRCGHVTEVLLTTIYGSITRLKHFEDVTDLISAISYYADVRIITCKRDWLPLSATGLLTVGAVLYFLI